ncbi:MAG TPA: alpha-E domain-containing protein [Propionicimonas sp.]|nr:alpha-E domain-containing protein [Propionicimonas sp.]HRA05777.1 alpha-E domain-containing protein [Propionicimonas sp.]
MLSRIAESFYWMGRYLERAEATTRLLAEHHQLVVEDKSVEFSLAAGVLLEALAISDARPSTSAHLARLVIGSPSQPATISGAVSAARDNARSIREALSSDTYESINAVQILLARGFSRTASPGVVLHRILERLLVVNGVVEWTMPRDEAHDFLVLGRELERIDMMGRMLAMRHDLLWPAIGPAAILRACGGLSAFLRSGEPAIGAKVRAFLVLDRTFPRSMRACADDAEQAVRSLASIGVTDGGQLLSEVGMLRSNLEYASADQPGVVDALIETAAAAGSRAAELVNAAYFRQHGTIVWSH